MRASLPLLCLLVAAASAQHLAPAARTTPHMVRRTAKLQPRQGLLDIFGGSDNTTASDTSPTATLETSTSLTTPTTSSTIAISTTSSTTATPTSTSSTSTQPTSTSSSTRPTATSASQTTASTTNAAGSTVFLTETLAPTSSASVAVASASTTAAPSSGSGSHTGLIIGVSVVGGVAILGALIFLWMKFGGKRFSEYQDEDADIKWPELKTDGDSAAMQPLPARRTGGAGFDMGNEFDEQLDTDGQSMAEYGNVGGQSVTGSTTALNTGVGAGTGAGYGAGSATYGSGVESSGGYHDDSPGAISHYAQPVVAGYYDPYSSSAYPSDRPQTFYPEQGAAYEGDAVPNPHQSAQYEDYSNYGTDPYAAARSQAASTSPHMSPNMAPFRVNSQNIHRGF